MAEKTPVPSSDKMLARPDLALVSTLVEDRLSVNNCNRIRILNLLEPDAVWDIARKYYDWVDVDSLPNFENMPTGSRINFLAENQTYDIVHVGGMFEDFDLSTQSHLITVAARALKKNGQAVFVGCKPAIRNALYHIADTNITSPWSHEGPVLVNR